MKRLLTYMKLKPLESILAPLFKMLEACFELFVPLVVAVVDGVSVKTTLTGGVVLQQGVLVLRSLGMYISQLGLTQ